MHTFRNAINKRPQSQHCFRSERPGPPRKPAPVPDVLTFARTRLSFSPDPMQEALLRSGASRAIVNCSRQWGKSTIGALVALHRAYYNPESLVLIASPSEKQSAELVWKVRAFARRLKLKLKKDGSNRISLQFPNGARIVGLPGEEATSRGFSAPSLVIIDEAARAADESYLALRPMLATSAGDLWLLSTPFGKRGFFYECWEQGGEDWTRFSVPASECPRISEKYLAEERRQMGAQWYQQEFACAFIEDGHQMFSREVILRILDEGQPLFG